MTPNGTFAYHITPIGEPVEDWIADNEDRILPVAVYGANSCIAGVGVIQTLEEWIIASVHVPMKATRGPYPNIETEDGKLGWVDWAGAFAQTIDYKAESQYEADLKVWHVIERWKPNAVPYLGVIDRWDGEVRNITTRTKLWEFKRLDDESKG